MKVCAFQRLITHQIAERPAAGDRVSRLIDLIAQARAQDPQLGADLAQALKQLSSRLPFGLNLECHRPEAVDCRIGGGHRAFDIRGLGLVRV